MTGRVEGFPRWLRDVDATLPVTSQYVVHGNIRDRHLVPVAGGLSLRSTVDALWACLAASGYRFLLHHSPVHGLRVWPRTDPDAEQTARTVLGDQGGLLGTVVPYSRLAEVLHRVSTSADTRCALAVDYLSQGRPAGEPPDEEEHAFMLAALVRVHEARGYPQPGPRRAALYNPSFWFVDRPADLPPWLVTGSDGIRQTSIPAPDLDTRLAAATLLVPSLPGAGAEADEVGRASVADRFATVTEGMTLRSMIEVVQLAIDSETDAADIDDSVRAYRLGLRDNPWRQEALRERIRGGQEALESQVRGQGRAVRHALDILVRSTTGLTAAHQRQAGGGPRGILFFAGPTGVGKTELAKAITRLVFGDERAYVRFDMSEFAAEHAEARLIGSPPGYVGHGEGGELTNAVRRRPFSLVLFDEIEKAHPRILDKFLQILSDGRLTDGSGDTVHFSETVIVFTSNLGVVDAGDAAGSADFADRVRSAIERDFRERLNRPELLGRIGDNIVVFDHISPQVGEELAEAFLGNVLDRVRDELDVDVSLAPTVRKAVVAEATADLSTGGRGIGLKLESCFVNPLARALFELPTGSMSATVVDVREEAGGWWVVELG